ncbi:MAG: hypothetical protein JWP04_251 [Belnapia sp.]|nr:hypothetical protein [Belnapia sp.]
MTERPKLARRSALFLALASLSGCSVLPDRPYQEVQRYALAPERPQRGGPPSRGAPVLLVRTLRAAPGLDVRGLRLLGANGQVGTEYWQEWTAPPADLVEEALRRWLAASGRFAAVTLPGSRLRADVVLEGELIRLQAEPAAGLGRAALSVLLLAEPQTGNGEARILGQFVAEGSAPIAGGARRDGKLAASEAAAAMSAALGAALGEVEQTLARLVPARR